uniref:Uncharacterized protein n=1 Tax=Mola mola TaxID=94237 RepID=A0A3Q4BM26_MOLML
MAGLSKWRQLCSVFGGFPPHLHSSPHLKPERGGAYLPCHLLTLKLVYYTLLCGKFSLRTNSATRLNRQEEEAELLVQGHLQGASQCFLSTTLSPKRRAVIFLEAVIGGLIARILPMMIGRPGYCDDLKQRQQSQELVPGLR